MTMVAPNPQVLSLALFVVRVLSPSLVFVSALSLIITRPPTPTSPSPITSVVVASRVPRRALILSLLSLIGLSFLLDGLTFVIHAVLSKTWPEHTGIEINAVIGLAAFSGLAALGAWKEVSGVQVWNRKRVKAGVASALLLDIAHVVLVGLSLEAYDHSRPHIPEVPSRVPIPYLLHFVFPAFRVLLLLPLFFALLFPRVVFSTINSGDDVDVDIPTASSLLLPPSVGANPSTGLAPVTDASKYGTFRSARSTIPSSGPTTRAHTPAPPTLSDHLQKKSDSKQEVALDPSWGEIWRRLRRLSPYLWPSKSRSLQLVALACIVLLIIGRFVNIALPFSLGELVRILEEGRGQSPWPYLFAYAVLRFLQSSGGISALRDALWTPVMQYSDREMSQLSFDHLLNLSFAFHTRRKTGEILRILDRGAAINRTFELVLFSIIPTFLDIIVALVVFCVMFGWTLALVIFFVMFAYVGSSVVMTKFRTKIRREMNDRDIITRGIHTDCLLNYETVKYFNGEEHEAQRYGEAINEYQALEYRVLISLSLLNLVQNFIITMGLLVGSMIVALRVTQGISKPSDFVIFVSYLAQLYGPLNMIGYIYRSMNQSLVDTEKLLKLLAEPTEINDKPDAEELVVDEAEIEFENVSFSYDDRTTALNGVSFTVPRGSSVALVGESGAGKSTILRLLYRFYDLGEGEGRILIDGKDIRDVTQASLRRAIGVVPQDSALFNTSIGYNIGYGKFGASPEEIEAAAKAAQMHDRIMSFPDGYETKVGERGVRLSGGEKQRVAIARTLLKNPPILLLDEATSALDTSTEKDIQKALQTLVKGRSSLSIAHRLSTIASADIILVLKDGQIIERGSHKELIALNGIFAAMWADQISASEDPAVSIGAQSIKKEPVSGYPVDDSEAVPKIEMDPAGQEENLPAGPEAFAQEVIAADIVTDTPEIIAENIQDDAVPPERQGSPVAEELVKASTDAAPPVGFPTSEHEENPAEPVNFPSAEAAPVAPPAPLAFPTSDDADSPRASSERATPGVTFGPNVNSSPSRTGTPDPESEPKRKRISSQNFQRLARRISITTRKQGSSSSIPIFPGLRRDTSASQTPRDDGGEGSVRTSNDSPAASINQTETGKKDKKKDKKKRKSLM